MEPMERTKNAGLSLHNRATSHDDFTMKSCAERIQYLVIACQSAQKDTQNFRDKGYDPADYVRGRIKEAAGAVEDLVNARHDPPDHAKSNHPTARIVLLKREIDRGKDMSFEETWSKIADVLEAIDQHTPNRLS